MKQLLIKTSVLLACLGSFHALVAKEVQDMSDPLAVYSQIGLGVGDQGFKLRLGQAYKPEKPGYAAMNVLEFQGIGGELLGIRDNEEMLYHTIDNSIDVLRFRNFKVNLSTGLGAQIDAQYDVDSEALNLSYSLLKELPPMGRFGVYPLAGAGVTIANDKEDGYQVPGTFAMIGMYSKIGITKDIWLNYNPMYMHTLSGSDPYKSGAYNGMNSDGKYYADNSLLTHEFISTYQINPRTNVRYISNWSENVDWSNGSHLIEVGYQF